MRQVAERKREKGVVMEREKDYERKVNVWNI